MKNWKTTLFGILAGALQIAAASVTTAGAAGGTWHQQDYLQAGAGLLTMALGALAKDAGVTGTEK